MQIVTVRLDEDLVDDLEAEAEEHGFSNRTEYIRNLLRNRKRIQENTPENTTDYDERLTDIEERLAALEAEITENTPRKDDVIAQNTRESALSGGDDERMEHLADDDGAGGVPGGESDAASSDDHADDDARAIAERVAAREGWDDDGRREARIAAAAAAVRALQERGQLGRTEAVDDLGLYDEHPVAGQDDETWWRRNVRPVLQEVAEYSRGVHGYVLEEGGSGAEV